MSKNLQQVELAIETLKVFTDRGESMDNVRHVVHYFYDGNFIALSAALTELGYAVRPAVNDDGVVAERHEAIGEEWRTTKLVNLCELADTYGVEYDGWEASMERQPKQSEQASSAQKQGFISKLFGKKN
jgi:hypothetical protein